MLTVVMLSVVMLSVIMLSLLIALYLGRFFTESPMPAQSVTITINKEVLLKGRLRTVDLLSLTSLDQFLFISKIFSPFY